MNAATKSRYIDGLLDRNIVVKERLSYALLLGSRQFLQHVYLTQRNKENE